jgi:hypothetical protein
MLHEELGTIDIHELTYDLSFEFPDLDLGALINYIRRAASIMCREADLVRFNFELVTQPYVYNYLLSTLNDMEIVAILKVSKLTGPSHMNYRFEAPRTIWLKEDLISPQRYRIHMSLAPPTNACELDKRFQSMWYETLLHGVRAIIYDLPGRPWSSPQLAMESQRRFQAGHREHKIERMTNYQRGAARLTYGTLM